MRKDAVRVERVRDADKDVSFLLSEILDNVDVKEAPKYMELSPGGRTESYIEPSGYYIACVGIGKDHVAEVILSHEAYDKLMNIK